VNPNAGQPEPNTTPLGMPAVDDGLDASEDLGMDGGEPKKTRGFALVSQRAKGFLEAIRDCTLERLTREDTYERLAEIVFAYWAARLHHPNALLDRKRERRLMARLRESAGDWGQLCYAVDGALKDDWLMGRAMNSPRKYDGIETIFRDREQVERLAELCPTFCAGQPHPLVTKYEHHNGNGAE